MELIKLLDIANPKKIKDTLNVIIQNYENFYDEVKTLAEEATDKANIASEDAYSAAASAQTAQTQATTAQIAATNAAAEAASAATSADIAAADAIEAIETAEQALQNANEATETSELAMNIATEAKSTVDQAISTGVFGTFVYDTNNIALTKVYSTHNITQEDTLDHAYIATPKLVRDALTAYTNTQSLQVLLEDYALKDTLETYATLENLTNTLHSYYTAGTVDGLLNEKVDKESNKGLSTNDYTTLEKEKLAGLENYDDTELQNKDLENVKLTGNQTIEGVKTFTSAIETNTSVNIAADAFSNKLYLTPETIYAGTKSDRFNLQQFSILCSRLSIENTVTDNRGGIYMELGPNGVLGSGHYQSDASDAMSLGEEGVPWKNIYLAGDIYKDGRLYINNLPIGAITTSLIPLVDANVHLLDGALLDGTGIYADFVAYIATLTTTYAQCFTDETTWQNTVDAYGSCGKFVYNSTDNTVRLPKISNILEGTSDITQVGALVQAGLPNITGGFGAYGMTKNASTSTFDSSEMRTTGAFYPSNVYGNQYPGSGSGNTWYANADTGFNASRSSAIYGNSTTVQPQTVKALYYIVVANNYKNSTVIDIDNIANDLNGKADVDGTNINLDAWAVKFGTQTDISNLDTNKANIDASNITAASYISKLLTGAVNYGDKIIKKNMSGNGYVIFQSGLKILWGYISTTGATVTKTFPDSITFSVYPCIAITWHSTATRDTYAPIINREKTGFTLYKASSGAQAMAQMWIAIGY